MAMASHSVAEQTRRALEVHLVDGSWPVGTRLPAERVLAETLGVSRNSVREAIFCLKERGLLFSRHGSGVFVSDRLQTAISSPWRQLVAAHPDLRWGTLEFRRELEGATAYYAALRANASDLEFATPGFAPLDHAPEETDLVFPETRPDRSAAI